VGPERAGRKRSRGEAGLYREVYQRTCNPIVTTSRKYGKKKVFLVQTRFSTMRNRLALKPDQASKDRLGPTSGEDYGKKLIYSQPAKPTCDFKRRG